MNKKIQHLFHELMESYVLVLFLALSIGIFYHNQAIKLAPYISLFLAIIFFFSALKIDLKEILNYLSDMKMLVVVNLFMLILFPILTYYFSLWVVPSIAVALLILAAMPSGMTAPLLSEIVGGRQSLALVLTVITSLLAPLTVPIMIKLLAGTAVTVSFYSMFLSLAKIIFIPFILANIVKYFWHDKIKATYYTFKPISIALLGLLIMGVVAGQAEKILAGLTGEFLFYLAVLFVFFIILHFIGYGTVFWRDKKDRLTITVCLTYMNFTLAIYLVGKFFDDPKIIIPVIFSVLPWSLLVIPFKYIMKKVKIAD